MNEYRSHIAALIIVALVAPAAALLLIVALVVWLAELMGSVVLPCLILGIALALLATIIYKVSLRDALREVDERWRVIYEATKLLREAIAWGVQMFFGKRG